MYIQVYIYKCVQNNSPHYITLMDVMLHEKSMHAGACAHDHLIGASNNVDLYPLIPATII